MNEFLNFYTFQLAELGHTTKTQTLSMDNSMNRLLLLVMLNNLVACATFDLEPPSNVNLEGDWVLDSTLSQAVIFPPANIRSHGQKGGAKGGGPRGGGGDRGGSGKRGSEESPPSNNQSDQSPIHKHESATATQMTIDFASDSMGVMYKAGNYREIEWGKTKIRNRTINAGWQDDLLVIKMKGRNGTITEIYQLSENSNVLTLQFIVDGNQYKRVYRRQKQAIQEAH